MVGCSAIQCTNRSSKKSLRQLETEKNKAITFHKFPKEVKRRSLWIKALHRNNWLPNDNNKLCSEHFEVECFYKYFDNTVHLRGDAVPTRFPSFTNCFEKVPDNSSTIKKEFVEQEYIDDKVCIGKTVDMNICVGNPEINQYVSAADPIKIEPSSSEVCNDNISNNIVKTGNDIYEMNYQSKNGLSFCENCRGVYRDYCTKCGMLVRILNRKAKDGGRELIPEHILQLRECQGRLGIFALTSIPKDVRFGPFTGLATSGRSWKLKGGRFVASPDKSQFMNWLQYVNPVGDGPENNLVVSRCGDELYYRSVRKIRTNDELLVCFGAGYEDSLDDIDEVDFVPVAENARIAYACTFCCLGFSSVAYLIEHKTVCTNSFDGRISFKELMQCPFCHIYLEKREYSGYHMAYCQERNDGRRKTKTFKATEVENSDDDIENEEHQFTTREDSEDRLSVSVGSSQTDGTKQFECSECRFRTKYRDSLQNHVKSKHLKEFNYECQSCEYKSNLRRSLERHVKTKHLEFRYACEFCRYQTNHKVRLENHVRSKHRMKHA